ncbi:hypothetical protein GRJ2_003094600 [Grus japonensis]|uniref:Uncharacterized protein n=1 Tax=Grus japonensis TaxID=30415 RepID=A0ABC9Y8A3_GRUJA
MLSMHFSTGLFYKDTARQQEAVTLDGISNHRFKQSSALMAQGRRIELLGSIHSNLFFQDKHLLNDMNIKIKLMHCKDSFCFMSSPAAGACKLVITYASLFVKKVRVAPGVCLRHAEALIMANINYWMDWVHMKVFSILAISRASNQENLFLGQLPKLVVIGFIDNDTFSGSYAKNPFNFKRYDVNFVALEEFASGYTLFTFDLSPDQECADHCSLITTGNRFAGAFTTTVNMIVYSEFDNVIEINQRRRALQLHLRMDTEQLLWFSSVDSYSRGTFLGIYLSNWLPMAHVSPRPAIKPGFWRMSLISASKERTASGLVSSLVYFGGNGSKRDPGIKAPSKLDSLVAASLASRSAF